MDAHKSWKTLDHSWTKGSLALSGKFKYTSITYIKHMAN